MKPPNTFNAMISLIICGGLLVMLAFAQEHGPAGQGPGERAHGGPPPPKGGRMMLSFLGLTDAQKAQIETIQATEDTQAEALHVQLREAHDALAKATAKGQFNEAQVRTLAAGIAQTEIELTVIRARKDAAIYQVLTAEQRAKLDQFHAEHGARRPHPPRPE